MKKWGKRILFLFGFILTLFPFVSNVITQCQQQEAIATYQTTIKDEEQNKLEEIMEEANKYNELLFQTQGVVVDQVNLYGDEYYNNLLNCLGNGIMGSLEIPKINVNLPIYHGTEEDVLSKGVGHLKGTSLPVGGSSTHAVLSGHRGLPDSRLLLRMDEMDEGDFFFIKVCDQTLAYKVESIKVVKPDEVSALEIKSEKDLVSLVTCTPYGINTHRMIVTGSRTEYEESGYGEIPEAIPSLRELICIILPFLLVFVMIIVECLDRKGLKRIDDKENNSRNKHSVDFISKNSICTRKCNKHFNRKRKKKRFRSDCFDRRRERTQKRKHWFSMY